MENKGLKCLSVLLAIFLIVSCYMPCLAATTPLSVASAINTSTVAGLQRSSVKLPNDTVSQKIPEVISTIIPRTTQVQLTSVQTPIPYQNISAGYDSVSRVNPSALTGSHVLEDQVKSLLDLQAAGIVQINNQMSRSFGANFGERESSTRDILSKILYLKEKQKECETLLTDKNAVNQIPAENITFYKTYNQLDADMIALLQEILLINFGLIKVTDNYSDKNADANYQILQEVYSHLKNAEQISNNLVNHSKAIDANTFQKITGYPYSDQTIPSSDFFKHSRDTYLTLIDSLVHIIVIDAMNGKNLETEIKEQLKDLFHDADDLIPDIGTSGDALLGDQGTEFGSILSGRSHNPQDELDKILGGGTKDAGMFSELTEGLGTSGGNAWDPFQGSSMNTWSPYEGGTGSSSGSTKSGTGSKGSGEQWGAAIGTVIGGIAGGAGGAATGAAIGAAIGWIIDKIVELVTSSSEKEKGTEGKETSKDSSDTTKEEKGEKTDQVQTSKSSGSGDGGRTDQETGQNWGVNKDLKGGKGKEGYSIGDTSDQSPADRFLKMRQELAKYLFSPGLTSDTKEGFNQEDSGLGEDTARYTDEIKKIQDAEYTGKTGWDALPKWMKLTSHPVDVS